MRASRTAQLIYQYDSEPNNHIRNRVAWVDLNCNTHKLSGTYRRLSVFLGGFPINQRFMQ
ncbi:hypothetical protein AVDCRST_MAG84-7560 [uncultured Microcoleus sp.]|uniref:Uncharacterized protein n=1 Tax=uncultured Microcoleus sp. TaxID=259945 RepID=A0A6J4Q3N3_9CYAN|nr:hypothetical protein AVDCRST_MAG84-7560 [uncultured Microcoleus sp.]